MQSSGLARGGTGRFHGSTAEMNPSSPVFGPECGSKTVGMFTITEKNAM